jgi:hypothetical protein
LPYTQAEPRSNNPFRDHAIPGKPTKPVQPQFNNWFRDIAQIPQKTCRLGVFAGEIKFDAYTLIKYAYFKLMLP